MTNKKITELNSASAVDGTELVEVVQGGTNKKSLLSTVATYIKTVVGNLFDYIQFNTDPPTITDAGTLIWNKQEYTLDIITGLGATVQIGQEKLILYYNDTGLTISNGSVLHPNSGTTVSGFPVPTPNLADASTWELAEGTLSVATHDIPNGELGLATRFGRVREIDTSSFSPGDQIWLSATTPGAITNSRPVFPDYAISLGGVLSSDATTGQIFVSVTRGVEDTYNDAFDGAIRETFDFLVTSDGVTITGTLTNADNTKDLTLLFSDGLYTFDVTPGATIALTAGTDSAPQTNYVYIPISTKVLTISTTSFPSTEHCKVAQLEVQSATGVQSEGGARRNQNINDHLKLENDNGHVLHIAERIRQLNAEWDNGTEATLTGTTTNGYIQVTSGQVWQMHKQTFASFSMPTDSILIVNDNAIPYRSTTNLNTINAYSDGSSWNNEWGKIVIWGVANKTGEVNYAMCNLPSGGYNSEANAVSDALNYANYTIPEDYKGVGFLIGAFTIRISGGTITYNSGVGYQDLRGFFPNSTAGGGGGAGITTYLGLTDTPSTRSGLANYQVTVNSGETADEYTEQEIAGTGVTYGHINASAQSIAGVKTFLESGQNILTVKSSSNNAYIAIDKGSINNACSLILKVAGVSKWYYGLADSDTAGYDGSEAFIAQNVTGTTPSLLFKTDGFIYLPNTPSTATTTNPVLYRNSSTGAIEQYTQLKQNSQASASTITPTGDARENEEYITALAAALTINAPSGTAANGNTLLIRIPDNGTARALTWNAIYEVVGTTLPTTTVAGKKIYIGCIYNSTDTKWDVVSVVQEA